MHVVLKNNRFISKAISNATCMLSRNRILYSNVNYINALLFQFTIMHNRFVIVFSFCIVLFKLSFKYTHVEVRAEHCHQHVVPFFADTAYRTNAGMQNQSFALQMGH